MEMLKCETDGHFSDLPEVASQSPGRGSTLGGFRYREADSRNATMSSALRASSRSPIKRLVPRLALNGQEVGDFLKLAKPCGILIRRNLLKQIQMARCA